MSVSYYILIYNDHNKHNTPYINNLLESAKEWGKEFKIILFDKKHIDPAFMNEHKSIFKEQRGGGYWIWKPYIILETLTPVRKLWHLQPSELYHIIR